ncbi:SAVED domain-containing protein [Tuwongella immobilis]|uniref:SMODS-associated and fused to various effectors domain-containing protein n=1 Tax=Tuwongella immobilis TaxID=692036 RepID=A0A6C2YSB8_9BACT|nr:SAVED domain-containing protein [Tuwongella immobilis]VIP04244.1 unnamed protein product [Tuwongella immobilis]VTS05852.1 unnamed protein product [Tuwongella immobilis]
MNPVVWDLLKTFVSPVVSFGIGMWLSYWWQKRRMKKLVARMRRLSQSQQAEVALAISIGNQPIELSVRNYLDTCGMQAIGIEAFHHTAVFTDDPQTWEDYLHQLRTRIRDLKTAGVTRLHLFILSPVAIGVFAGALLHNGPEIVIYHYFNGVYAPIGTINSMTTKGP